LSVFIPDIGFRSADGVMLATPVTVMKGDDRGLMVLRLAATDAGTELAFEVRDVRLEEACATGRVDYRERLGEVRLRDGTRTFRKFPGQGMAARSGATPSGLLDGRLSSPRLRRWQ
jgi:hypothetical protein